MNLLEAPLAPIHDSSSRIDLSDRDVRNEELRLGSNSQMLQKVIDGVQAKLGKPIRLTSGRIGDSRFGPRYQLGLKLIDQLLGVRVLQLCLVQEHKPALRSLR